MARKSSKLGPQHAEAGQGSQDAPEQGTRRPITKVGAVKAALVDGSGSPEEGVAFIKSRFGLDITRPHFSAIKSQLKKREGITRGIRRVTRPSSPRLAASPARPANGEAALLEALEVMKPLVDQFGADKVKRLVELLD